MPISPDDKEFLIRLAAAHAALTCPALGSQPMPDVFAGFYGFIAREAQAASSADQSVQHAPHLAPEPPAPLPQSL